MDEIYLYVDIFAEKLQSAVVTETDAEDDYNEAMLPKLELFQDFARNLPQVILQMQDDEYPLPHYQAMPSLLVHCQLRDELNYPLGIAGIPQNRIVSLSNKPAKRSSLFHEEPEEKRARTEELDYLLPMMFPRPRPLNLLAAGSRPWNMVLKKLTYQEIGRMEETCRTMKDYISSSNIKGILNVYELHYNHIDDLTASTLQRIKRLLQENEARVDKVFLGKILEPAPALLNGPELAELLAAIGAKRLFANCQLQREDVRRREIKTLEALSIAQRVEIGLDGFVLRQIMCPILRIAWNEVTPEALSSLLEQWKNGTRSIKCLTVDQHFEIEEVLADLDGTNLQAQPVWTNEVQDQRCSHLLSIGGWESNLNIKIYAMTRSILEERTIDDYLLLFFGRCRFIAATLDGIVDEKVIDALKEL